VITAGKTRRNQLTADQIERKIGSSEIKLRT